ncbi:MAG: TlpA disulfide reductase family protein [Bacteroidota bacterium]
MPKFKKGQQAQAFSVVMENGETLALENFKGKYVLLDFWGSWCGPCRAEAKSIVNLYDSFHGKAFKNASDFEIISIGLETNEQRWKSAIQKDGYRWPYHFADFKRMKTAVATDYGVREIPTKYLIDPDGYVVGVNMSFEEMQSVLKGALK